MAEKIVREKFVSIDKMSKKQKRKQNAMKRNGWNEVLPVTKVIPNKKKLTCARMKAELKSEQLGKLL